jgi:hypothetical protein
MNHTKKMYLLLILFEIFFSSTVDYIVNIDYYLYCFSIFYRNSLFLQINL